MRKIVPPSPNLQLKKLKELALHKKNKVGEGGQGDEDLSATINP